MNNNINDIPSGTLTMTQIDSIARGIEGIIRDRKVRPLTITQMNHTIDTFLDCPHNRTDLMRIRVRTAALIDDLLTNA